MRKLNGVDILSAETARSIISLISCDSFVDRHQLLEKKR